jgi:hypothetical protein
VVWAFTVTLVFALIKKIIDANSTKSKGAKFMKFVAIAFVIVLIVGVIIAIIVELQHLPYFKITRETFPYYDRNSGKYDPIAFLINQGIALMMIKLFAMSLEEIRGVAGKIFEFDGAKGNGDMGNLSKYGVDQQFKDFTKATGLAQMQQNTDTLRWTASALDLNQGLTDNVKKMGKGVASAAGALRGAINRKTGGALGYGLGSNIEAVSAWISGKKDENGRELSLGEIQQEQSREAGEKFMKEYMGEDGILSPLLTFEDGELRSAGFGLVNFGEGKYRGNSTNRNKKTQAGREYNALKKDPLKKGTGDSIERAARLTDRMFRVEKQNDRFGVVSEDTIKKLRKTKGEAVAQLCERLNAAFLVAAKNKEKRMSGSDNEIDWTDMDVILRELKKHGITINTDRGDAENDLHVRELKNRKLKVLKAEKNIKIESLKIQRNKMELARLKNDPNAKKEQIDKLKEEIKKSERLIIEYMELKAKNEAEFDADKQIEKITEEDEILENNNKKLTKEVEEIKEKQKKSLEEHEKLIAKKKAMLKELKELREKEQTEERDKNIKDKKKELDALNREIAKNMRIRNNFSKKILNDEGRILKNTRKIEENTRTKEAIEKYKKENPTSDDTTAVAPDRMGGLQGTVDALKQRREIERKYKPSIYYMKKTLEERLEAEREKIKKENPTLTNEEVERRLSNTKLNPEVAKIKKDLEKLNSLTLKDHEGLKKYLQEQLEEKRKKLKQDNPNMTDEELEKLLADPNANPEAAKLKRDIKNIERMGESMAKEDVKEYLQKQIEDEYKKLEEANPGMSNEDKEKLFSDDARQMLEDLRKIELLNNDEMAGINSYTNSDHVKEDRELQEQIEKLEKEVTSCECQSYESKEGMVDFLLTDAEREFDKIAQGKTDNVSILTTDNVKILGIDNVSIAVHDNTDIANTDSLTILGKAPEINQENVQASLDVVQRFKGKEVQNRGRNRKQATKK